MLSSCGTVFEDGEICPPEIPPVVEPQHVYRVRFDDSRNMNFADAFSSEVNSVRLFVVDSQTKEILLDLEESDLNKLHTPGYTMELPQPSDSPAIPVPDYTDRPIDLVAWCGLDMLDVNATPSFALTQNILGTGQIYNREDLGVSLYGDLANPVNRHLDELHHGMLLSQTVLSSKDTTLVVPLTRNTNNVRIVLQRTDGSDLSADDFSFELTAGNGQMDWDNSLPNQQDVTYTEYVKTNNNSTTGGQVVVGELSTARLVKGNSVRLRAKHLGKTLLDIPLITYSLLVKGHYNQEMSDQEFLDRQNDWSFIFFLNDQNQWEQSNLYVNDWHVVVDEKEL